MASEPMELADPLPPVDTMPVKHLVAPWVLALQRKRLEENLNKLIRSGDIPLPKSLFKVEEDLSVSFVCNDDNESATSVTPAATPSSSSESSPLEMTDDDWSNLMGLMRQHRNPGTHVQWSTLNRELKDIRNAGPKSGKWQKADILEMLQNCAYFCNSDVEDVEAVQKHIDPNSENFNLQEVCDYAHDCATSLLRLSGVSCCWDIPIDKILRLFGQTQYDRPPGKMRPVLDFIALLHDIEKNPARTNVSLKPAKRLLDRIIKDGNWVEHNSFLDGFIETLRFEIESNAISGLHAVHGHHLSS